eukprot:584370-Rhodomonas_salina.1
MTTLVPGAQRLADCHCDAGSYRTSDTECAPCTPPYVCPDGRDRVHCPGSSTSAPPYRSARDCHCVDTTYPAREDPLECVPCAANNYCAGGVSRACPLHSWSQTGAGNISHCLCDTYFTPASDDTHCRLHDAIPT